MKILVTGALGQIGSHIIELLLENGVEVYGIDNLTTGRREHLRENPLLKLSFESISNLEKMNDIFEEFKPDVVLMDLKMPVMDGLEATEAIRKDETLKDTPVIVISATVRPEDEQKVRDLCNGFIRKPVKKTELFAILQNYLESEKKES